MNDYKSVKILSGFIWRFLERSGAQMVTFLVSIVLARVLGPDVYGTVALITVFITIMQVFVDSGLGNALIQKKDVDNLDYSTVFYANIIFCVVIYTIMWIAAPTIGLFYKDTDLVPYIRVLGLTIVISGIKNVQQAYVTKNMMFKKFFFSTLGGTIGAAAVGLFLAFRGMGVWAIIVQQLFNLLVDTLILWIIVKWRPMFAFSIKRFKTLFSYGWKLLISTLLDTGYNNLRQLLIGKYYTTVELAYYNQGIKFPQVIISNINTSIDSVLLPVLANDQDYCERVKSMTRRSIKISVYLIAPLMIGLALCSNDIIRILLADEWLPCAKFMRISCVCYTFYPIHTANLNAIKALGRSDLFLKLEIIKKIIGLILLVGSLKISVLAIAYSLVVSTLFSTLINAFPNRQLLDYGWKEQMKDILSSIACAIVMGVVVYIVGRIIDVSVVVGILIKILVGIFVYIIMSAVTYNDSFIYLVELVKKCKKGYKYERKNFGK